MLNRLVPIVRQFKRSLELKDNALAELIIDNSRSVYYTFGCGCLAPQSPKPTPHPTQPASATSTRQCVSALPL